MLVEYSAVGQRGQMLRRGLVRQASFKEMVEPKMLPRFYLSSDKPQPWNVVHAAIYGAGIGLAAALLKTFGLFHGPAGITNRSVAVLDNLPEIAGAALGFAALCALAAALRNFIAGRLV
jgi:hypothetical protein